MKWYYQIQGGHTHVRVFLNGACCGNLCFRNEEFALVAVDLANANVQFIEEPPMTPLHQFERKTS